MSEHEAMEVDGQTKYTIEDQRASALLDILEDLEFQNNVDSIEALEELITTDLSTSTITHLYSELAKEIAHHYCKSKTQTFKKFKKYV
mgnify:CR=1 FL=1